jgi:hypothetical protein
MAVEVGNIDIEVSAVSKVAGDAVRKQLLVEACIYLYIV